MKRCVTAALAAVLVLGACGGGTNTAGKKPFQLVAAASAETLKAQTARFTMHVAVDGSVFGGESRSMSFGTSGEIDFRDQHGRATFDFGDLAKEEDVPKNMEMVFAGTTVFIKGGPYATPAGKPWVKIDGAEIAGLSGGLPGGDLQAADPTKALDYLEGVSDEVVEVGREKVRGEDTRHLKATLDPAKAAGSFPAAAQGVLRQVNGGRGLDLDVWVDGAGRLRKLTMSIRLSQILGALAPGDSESTPTTGERGDEKAAVSTTFELFDFGTKVDVAPPPADQVVPVADVKPTQ
jgi:hypothetical protein